MITWRGNERSDVLPGRVEIHSDFKAGTGVLYDSSVPLLQHPSPAPHSDIIFACISVFIYTHSIDMCTFAVKVTGKLSQWAINEEEKNREKWLAMVPFYVHSG